MNKLVTLLGLLTLCATAPAKDAITQRQLLDRAAIEEVMQKYVWTVDSLDADGYVSVFTEDAEIHTNGTILKGHAQIRTVVTDMQTRQAANRAAGKPVGAFYHVISNETISFQSPTEALYRSYWQTMRKGTDNRYTAGGFGRSEDHLVKQRDGSWLIKTRKLSVYTD
jgi:uncharacterized protein (TIGR02246 family)